MNKYDFDLFVIGAGSGGVRVARWSAGLGAKVAICEDDRYGGTCVIRGCIPKKLMVIASHFSEDAEAAKAYGWSTQGMSFDWKLLKKNRDKEIERLSGLYQKMLKSKEVTAINGRGKLIGPHKVEVNGKEYSARRIVVATGGSPWTPDIPGIEHAYVSDHMFTLEEQPKKAVIVGSGYIGVEFAGILHGLGTEVEVVFRGEELLRGFDMDVRKFLKQEMLRKGITISTGIMGTQIEKTDTGLAFTTSDGKTRTVDAVFYATGRRPKSKNLGLEELGVEMNDKGAIKTNEIHQTNIESIYALGDVTDRVNLTPVATAEGTLLAERLYNKGDRMMDYDFIPSAVFSQPPIATVGDTEELVKEKGLDYLVFESDFRALKHTLSGLEERTYMKLIVEKSSEKILGCHMVGTDAAEILQGMAIAIKSGATKKDFDRTIGIHPSSAEEFVTMRTAR